MSPYTVYVAPAAWKEIKALPGYMRQRVKRAIDNLADDPRPHNSVMLRRPSTNVSCGGSVWTDGGSCMP